jgi:hypothetical protein
MKMFSYLWQYLAKFFLECEMFYTKVVEKIETDLMYNNVFFFRKSHRLWDVEKYGGATEATNGVTT